MKPNRSIAGMVLLAGLTFLVFSTLNQWRPKQPQINHRLPASALGYCSSIDVRPCIVSFGLDSDGNMLVNILIPGPSFPDFYLRIIHSKGESIYECQKVEMFQDRAYCIGEDMHPGEALQYMIVSREGDSLLAEGNFAIVGLALAAPEIALPTPTNQPTASPTQGSFIKTPTPIRGTPTSRPPYPNPSYP